jgi:hypothetical protein
MSRKALKWSIPVYTFSVGRSLINIDIMSTSDTEDPTMHKCHVPNSECKG